ncbi:YeiH family protein [Rhizohabitans arisaemae]|uniref:YeiH family protein n=1 Tax=Rhizohabitans arisaemae TaxID=2720610 RepID=UPI0024B23A86|nr:putative sulfate exporter family transporter [Rhizohabitans arisaemae]
MSAHPPITGPRLATNTTTLPDALPGIGAAAAAVAIAYAVNAVLPRVSPLLVTVVLGAALVNLGGLHPTLRPGIRLVTRRLLRLGIVLLGLQLALPQILGLGVSVLAVVVVATTATFLATRWLGPRIGVSPARSLLIAGGVSICGAAAIAAMEEVSEGDGDDVAAAIAVITVYGTLAILLLPMLQAPLGLDDPVFGAWVGASVHEVAQVAAAGAAAGPAALAVAVVVKLGRVVLLAPMVAGTAFARRRRSRGDAAKGRPPVVPLFVAGFLAMVALGATGWVPEAAVSASSQTATLLLAAALFGLGTGVRVTELVRSGRALILGAVATALISAISLIGLTLAG